MNTEVKLLMTFMTQFGRKVSLFVTDPREDITESEIKAVKGYEAFINAYIQ